MVPEKNGLIAEAEEKVKGVEADYQEGLITIEERKKAF